MSFSVANTGDTQMLTTILNKATPENLVLHLFSNNVTPTKAFTVSSLTECSGAGYAAINLVPGSWTVTAGTGAGTTPTTAAYPAQTFTLTGALTAYGYYLVGATSGLLYLAESFTGGPFITPAGGGTISVTPNITSFS